MDAFNKTYKAVFPQAIEVPELGLTLMPLTVAHFAAMDCMDIEMCEKRDGKSFVTFMAAATAMWLSQLTPEKVTEILCSGDSSKRARVAAVEWVGAFRAEHRWTIIESGSRLIREGLETAVPSENPSMGASDASSDGPSNSSNASQQEDGHSST